METVFRCRIRRFDGLEGHLEKVKKKREKGGGGERKWWVSTKP